MTHPHAEIDAVRDDVRSEFLEWFGSQKWSKKTPVGFLAARLYYDGKLVKEIDAFAIRQDHWPSDRDYERVALGKLALREREGLDTIDIVSQHMWLLKTGDCRYGGAGIVTPRRGRHKIVAAFSGLLEFEDVVVYMEYGRILLKHLNRRALDRLRELDASGAPDKAFIP